MDLALNNMQSTNQINQSEFSLPEKKTRVLLFWGNLTKHKATILKER